MSPCGPAQASPRGFPTPQSSLKRLKGPHTQARSSWPWRAPHLLPSGPKVPPVAASLGLQQPLPGPSRPSAGRNPLQSLLGLLPSGPSSRPWPAAEPSPRGPSTHAGSGQLQTTPEQHPPNSMHDTPNRQTGQHRGPTKANPAPRGQPCMTASPLWSARLAAEPPAFLPGPRVQRDLCAAHVARSSPRPLRRAQTSLSYPETGYLRGSVWTHVTVCEAPLGGE